MLWRKFTKKINNIREHVADVKSKGRDRGKFFSKILLLNDSDLYFLIEMVKEEMIEFKVYLHEQVVAYHSTETAGWYIQVKKLIHKWISPQIFTSE